MNDVETVFRQLSERGTPVGRDAMRKRVLQEIDGRTVPIRVRRGMPNWAVAVSAAALALVLIGGVSLLLRAPERSIQPLVPADSDTTLTSSPVNASKAPAVDGVTTWVNPNGGTLLTLYPSAVPAQVGVVQIAVQGEFVDGEPVWLMTCPGARGQADVSTWEVTDGVTDDVCPPDDTARADGTLLNPAANYGSFTTTLSVTIDAQAIADGGVVIVTGDMWLPFAGTALLRIVDGVEPEQEIDSFFTFDDPVMGPDGSIYFRSSTSIIKRDAAGKWQTVDASALPTGAGMAGWWPGRTFQAMAVGPAGELWVAGFATTAADDERFGGVVDHWTNNELQHLSWIARHDCVGVWCSWDIFTSKDVPHLGEGVGAIAVSETGDVYAPVGEDTLLVYDGLSWASHAVPGVQGVFEWSGSVAMGGEGLVWFGTNDPGSGRGLLTFDGTAFERDLDAEDALGGNIFQVAVATDGSIWAASDAMYGDPEKASPEKAPGVARYDGVIWTGFTVEDGLLSNDAYIVTGPDGSVWAVHDEIPPYGYSKYTGSAWIGYELEDLRGGITAAVVDGEGAVWTVVDGHLVSFDGTSVVRTEIPFGQP